MRLRDAARNGQPKPIAPVSGSGGVGAVEPVKQARKLQIVHAGAVVFHRQHGVLSSVERHHDLSRLVGVFDRIVQQNRRKLANGRFVAGDLHIRLGQHAQAAACALGGRRESHGRIVHRVAYAKACARALRAFLVHARERDEVVDQAAHAAGLLFDAREPFVFPQVQFKNFAVCGNDRQRRFEFVPGVGEKVRALLGGKLFRADVADNG